MSDENREVLSVLPICGAQSPEATWAGLSVSGLVARPRDLDAAGLSRLAQGEMVDDFRCVSGWVAPDQRWEGVPVAALLDDAGPLPEGRYVGFTSATPWECRCPRRERPACSWRCDTTTLR